MDPDARNGMQTCVWGPPLWFFLHTMAANYPLAPVPRAARRRYLRFLDSLGGVLPCGACRRNFRWNLVEALRRTCRGTPDLSRVPIADLPVFRGREAFFGLVYELHAVVSETVKGTDPWGRPVYRRPDRDAVRREYEQYRARCGADHARGTHRGCVDAEVKKQCRVTVTPRDHDYDTRAGQCRDRIVCEAPGAGPVPGLRAPP